MIDDGFEFPPTAHPAREMFSAILFVFLIAVLAMFTATLFVLLIAALAWVWL